LDYIILIFLYIDLNVYIRGTLIVNSDIKKSVYSFTIVVIFDCVYLTASKNWCKSWGCY